MIFRFNAGLFHLAAGFTGKYSPYQAVQVAPHPEKGVLVCATDRGAAAFLGHDPNGRADGTVCFLPDRDVVKASNPISTAERTLEIDTEARLASVSTHRKTADDVVQMQAPVLSNIEFPALFDVLKVCVQRWDGQLGAEVNAGRYDGALIRKAVDAARLLGDSVVLSGFDGGPIRVEAEGSGVVLLVMPQTAAPLPAVPEWVRTLAA